MENGFPWQYLICLVSLIAIPVNFFVALMLAFSFDDNSEASKRAADFFSRWWLWNMGYVVAGAGLVASLVASMAGLLALAWACALVPILWPVILVVVRIALHRR